MEDRETNVPERWTEKTLGEILNYEQPYRYSVNSTDYDDKSGTPVLTAGKSFILGYTTETEGTYNNLPVIIFDDFTTDSKYVDFPFKVKSSAMKFLMPKEAEVIDLKLVFAHIQRLRIRDLGGDHKRRWISDFSKLKIQLPPPDEQRQIARILSKVDEAISQTEQLIAKYRHLKTGLMQDLLTKGIDEDGNIRSEETHTFKDSPIGRIPVEWEVETLEKLLADIPNNMRSGPFGSALTKSEWVESGIPYLGIDNVQKERFIPIYNRHISIEKYNQLIRYSVNPFDVMITIMGTVGRSCVVPEGVGKAISSKHVWNMTFNKEKYFPELISYQLNYSPWISKAMREDTQGGVMPSINSALLKKLRFPVPVIDEQKLIAGKYAAIQEFLNRLSNSLRKYKSLKSGLMQDLLSGKVRVEQLIRETAEV